MDKKSLYCLGWHFKVIVEDQINDRPISLVKACETCKYIAECKADWLYMMDKLYEETGIGVNLRIPTSVMQKHIEDNTRHNEITQLIYKYASVEDEKLRKFSVDENTRDPKPGHEEAFYEAQKNFNILALLTKMDEFFNDPTNAEPLCCIQHLRKIYK